MSGPFNTGHPARIRFEREVWMFAESAAAAAAAAAAASGETAERIIRSAFTNPASPALGWPPCGCVGGVKPEEQGSLARRNMFSKVRFK